MFDQELSRYKENVCLITENSILSYKELDEICTSFQEKLPTKKQLILIRTNNNLETIIGYLSSLRSNHACILLDSNIDEQFIAIIVNTYKPNYIWEEKIPSSNYIYTYSSYGLRVNNKKNLLLYSDLALLLSTSGTTGSPKMVRLSKTNLYSNTSSIVQYLNITKSHRAITNLALHYSYGLSVLNTHLSQGASIVVTGESIISKGFWDLFKRFGVTTLNGVPYNYEIFHRIGLMKMSLPSLKYMTQAGGKLNHKVVEKFAIWSQEKNIQFYVMYGQTEATARIAYLSYDKVLLKSNSIGTAIPGGALFIKDLKEDGELIYEGENVMLGYATSFEDLSLGDTLHGILHTGDIATKDSDGYFYIDGRLKRFIKMHGNRVSLDEIENYLKSENYRVLCTGIDDLLMIGCLDEDKIEEIGSLTTKRYKFHPSVVNVKHIEDYPVTTSGKINYKEVIKKFQCD